MITHIQAEQKMKKLVVEVNKNFIKAKNSMRIENAYTTTILITPPLNSDYWLFRVRLFQDQAIVAFPKFVTLGIGFAIEEEDWNTNLPYFCDAKKIYEHIKVNKKYDEITEDKCLEAIQAIQDYYQKHIKNICIDEEGQERNEKI